MAAHFRVNHREGDFFCSGGLLLNGPLKAYAKARKARSILFIVAIVCPLPSTNPPPPGGCVYIIIGRFYTLRIANRLFITRT